MIQILKEATVTELQDAIAYLMKEHGITINVMNAENDKQIHSVRTQAKAKDIGADTLFVEGSHTNVGQQPNALAAYTSAVLAHLQKTN